MFPALPDLSPEKLPGDTPCWQYPAIAEHLPALVRRTAQNVWHDRRDPAIAAADVFCEEDGVHSFFEVRSMQELVAVGTYLSKRRAEPFKCAVYFCVLPRDLRGGYEIMEMAEDESRCPPLNALHRHVRVDSGNREQLFSAIQEARQFNYRVDRRAMLTMSALLRSHRCLDYTDGPCDLCTMAKT
jgi:hypothetical protein